MRSLTFVLAALVFMAASPLPAQQLPPPAAPPDPAQARGAVAGQVIDKETGRPLPFSNVVVVGTPLGTQSDLDGRFRITLVPAGLHSVRAMRIGYTPSQVDSVRITPGSVSTVTFALTPAAQTLQGVVIEAAPARASSDDGLLAAQKAAPRVSDGISAEAIRRAPGSDAAEAIVRVTGVSVLDKKFVVIRGLPERYGNTLLNGVELTSPEPLKKIVPLDVFPSSLLESIVTTKTATPDRPADFAGGSVEITTKEFPDQQVAEVTGSIGYTSQATFRSIAHPQLRGIDFLGFDQGNRRQMPADPPPPGISPAGERFAEQLRNVWTPAPSPVAPDVGLGINLGGRFGSEESPLGYAVAVTYSNKMEYTPNRLNQLVFSEITGLADRGYVAREATSSVDLGAIANFAVRAGIASKFGWKNLYTRNAEEMLAANTGFEVYNGNVERHIYQARYVTRELFQTQLTGDHYLQSLFDSRIEWKATYSASARNEPENRSLLYFKDPVTGQFRQGQGTPGPYWFRFLDDRLYGAQLDAGLPLRLRGAVDALLKVGGSFRARQRRFNATFYRMYPTGDVPEAYLEPELALAPENIGSRFIFERFDADALPYESDDNVVATYAMLDLPLPGGLRIIGGNRMEDWGVDLFQGTRDAPLQDPTGRDTRDYLWSGNLTWSVTERQNIRLAGYRTVARPDPRELSPDGYTAVTGDCGNRGNPGIERTRIDNYDVRWEFYPEAGELFSISGFYKDFERPIIEKLVNPGSGRCDIVYDNVERARNFGAEFEVRKSLGFLPGPWSNLAVGANVTIVRSMAEYIPFEGAGVLELPLQGQSDYIANANLLYTDDNGFQASVLVNSFGERIVRYGEAVNRAGEADQIPHVIEQGRTTIDAKVQKRFGRLSASLSGRNLTDAESIFFQDSDVGRTRTGYSRPGVSVSLGFGYAVR